jgi:hypothetical protein
MQHIDSRLCTFDPALKKGQIAKLLFTSDVIYFFSAVVSTNHSLNIFLPRNNIPHHTRTNTFVISIVKDRHNDTNASFFIFRVWKKILLMLSPKILYA